MIDFNRFLKELVSGLEERIKREWRFAESERERAVAESLEAMLDVLVGVTEGVARRAALKDLMEEEK